MSDEFKVGDLVWAKMKGFSPWPGRVSVPTPELKHPKKASNLQCIYFFGTNNFAWIEDNNIKPYAEFKEQLIKSSKTVAFKDAVNEIEEYILHPEKFPDIDAHVKDPEEEFDKLREHMGKEDEVTEEPEAPKKKTSSTPKIRLSTKSKTIKRSSSTGTKSAPRKKTKRTSSRSEEYENTRNNLENYFDNKQVNMRSSLLSRPSNVIRPDTPPLDLNNVSDNMLGKNIVPSKMVFGFLGLGIMGSGIVKNLINSGHKVVVWNRTALRCKEFEQAGAYTAVTPCDVVEEADITFSCVADPQAAKEMVFGNCGVLHCPSLEGKGYVEMTSMDSDTSKDIDDAIKDKGGRYCEAQIQGSKTEAEEGALVILIAGNMDLFKDCQTCFHAMSNNVFYLGETIGNACKMNSVLQLISGVSLAGLAEGLALADRASLKQADLLEILRLTSLSSPLLVEKGRAMIEAGYTTHQPLTHMQKDLKVALSLGDSLEQSMPLTATTNEIFKHAKRLGYANHDVSAIYIRARF